VFQGAEAWCTFFLTWVNIVMYGETLAHMVSLTCMVQVVGPVDAAIDEASTDEASATLLVPSIPPIRALRTPNSYLAIPHARGV